MFKNIRYCVFVIILLFSASAWAAMNIRNYFHDAELYPTDEEPLDVAVADLNHDNLPDVVTANRKGRSLSVFLGNEDGTLTFFQEVDIQLGGTSLAMADLNLDKNIDVIVSACDYGCVNNEIQIHHGSGDGKLTLAARHNVGGVPYNITIRDFNQDKFPDIAASDAVENRIILLFNNQDGENFEVRSLPTGRRPISLAVGDINADGFFDLCSANQWDDNVTLYFGLENGAFSKPETIKTMDLPYNLTIEDINGDAFEDLIVAHSSAPGRIVTYLGNKEGKPKKSESLPANGRAIFVCAKDFNFDGQNDIAFTLDDTQDIHVRLNNNGLFLLSEPLSIISMHGLYSLLIDDINNDSYPDLLAVEFNQSILSIALGRAPEE